MTVAELIAELSEFPPNMAVFCSGWDDHYEESYLSNPEVDEIEVIENDDGSVKQLFYGDERPGVKAVVIR